jgi:tRNA(Ile)-lysidine synthase
VLALHVNYGLRSASDADEAHCAELCGRLGVELEVVRPPNGAPGAPGAAGGAPGNLQAWARRVRYQEAARRSSATGALVATGHTANDQVETILYRLASSPGRRALLGMREREDWLLRPMLAVTREQTAAYCAQRGLAWREDASNADERYARTRVRERLLPALLAVQPAALGNVLRTAQLLREETDVLDALIDAELAGGPRIAIDRLAALPPALARLAVVRLAEEAAGTYVPQAGDRVGELIALGRRSGRAELHIGALVAGVVEDGVLTMATLPPRHRGGFLAEGD